MGIRDINSCKTFEEVRKMRLNLDEQIRSNKLMLDDILTKIYKNSTHFIYELMQNADDAKAKKARFVLYDDKIEFYHNGTKDFDLPSIIGITGIGDSKKKDDEKTIGKFGVGFKSVFRITKAPYIYNRLCSFKIERICVPEKIQSKKLPDDYTTEFELPFDSEKGLKKVRAFKEIKDELRTLNALSVMFMNHLKVIEIRGKVQADIILEEKKMHNGLNIIENSSDGSRYIVFRGGTENRVAIAYQLNAGGVIVSCEKTDISVYFPTHVRSGLAFRVNAPFDTPVTREDIDFASAVNKKVLKEVGDVFDESIIKLRDAGYYNCYFAEDVLPVDNYWDYGELREYLFGRLISLFKKNSLVPIAADEFRKSNNTVLADNYAMTELWQYDGKPWADIPYCYKNFRNFLIYHVGVKEIDLEQFAKDVSKSIKGSDRDDTAWLYDFYSYCGENRDCQKLREIPIIKNRADGFVSAWKNESQNIFKPPAKGVSNTRIINKILSDDALERLAKEDYRKADNIKRLLSLLEIKERSPKSTIEMDIMSKWNKETSLSKLKTMFFEMANIYNSANRDEKNVIANYLRDKKIFYGGNGNQQKWCKGGELYSRDEYLISILGRHNVDMIDRSFWVEKYSETTDKNGNTTKRCEGTSELCEALGVSRSFKTVEYKKSCRIDYSDIKNRYRADIYKSDYGFGFKSDRTVKNIEEIIASIKTPTDSCNVVRAIARIPKEELTAKIGASSERAYIHSSSPIIEIPAYFLRLLNDEKWIIKDDKRISPHEIMREDFIRIYNLTGSEPFLDWMLFEPDGIQNLSENARKLVEISDVIPEEEIQKLYNKYSNPAKEAAIEAIETDNRPNKAIFSFKEVSLKEYAPEVDETYNDMGATNDLQVGVRAHKEKTARMGEKAKVVSNYKKQIGDEGENETLNKLLSEYQSSNGFSVQPYCGNHKAYDFKVTKDGGTIKYIDSKYSEDGTIEMSPSQVDAAAEYGDKYELYVYIGRQKEFAKIVNPYEKFANRKIKSGIVFHVSSSSIEDQ